MALERGESVISKEDVTQSPPPSQSPPKHHYTLRRANAMQREWSSEDDTDTDEDYSLPHAKRARDADNDDATYPTTPHAPEHETVFLLISSPESNSSDISDVPELPDSATIALIQNCDNIVLLEELIDCQKSKEIIQHAQTRISVISITKLEEPHLTPASHYQDIMKIAQNISNPDILHSLARHFICETVQSVIDNRLLEISNPTKIIGGAEEDDFSAGFV